MKNALDAVAEVRFTCAMCDREAGHIRLAGSPLSSQLQRWSFTSTLTAVVPAEQFSALRSAIEQRDARRLYELDLEYAPFFCPQCDAIYCGAHWKRWDVFDKDDPSWHDSIRGQCPKGHERMLED
ncbi:MAG TPA: hypothetical protein VEZ11_19155 [Thermoanaerobaculia bacterium]|nr:hypothetical protein [Thermoanaerobaculia bacterium]